MPEPLTHLQERLAHLERHVEQLDEVLRTVHDRVDALARSIDDLRRESRRRLVESEGAPEEETPPHWGGRAQP